MHVALYKNRQVQRSKRKKEITAWSHSNNSVNTLVFIFFTLVCRYTLSHTYAVSCFSQVPREKRWHNSIMVLEDSLMKGPFTWSWSRSREILSRGGGPWRTSNEPFPPHYAWRDEQREVTRTWDSLCRETPNRSCTHWVNSSLFPGEGARGKPPDCSFLMPSTLLPEPPCVSASTRRQHPSTPWCRMESYW